MERNSLLPIPLSLVFTRPKPELNLHFVINDYHDLPRRKVCKNIAIVAPLVFCTDYMGKVLLMVGNDLFPGLAEGSLSGLINNLFQSFFNSCPDLVKAIYVGRMLVVFLGAVPQSIIQAQLSTSRMPLQLNQKNAQQN